MKLTDPIRYVCRSFGINPKKGKITSRNKWASFIFIVFGILWLFDYEVGILSIFISILFFYLSYKILYKKEKLSRAEWYAVPLIFLLGIFYNIGFLLGYLL